MALAGQEAVKDGICREIISGTLKSGDRISSIRELVDKYSVALLTAYKACASLKEKGIIFSLPQQGYFVSDNALSSVRRCLALKKYSTVIATQLQPSVLDDFYQRLLHGIHQKLSSRELRKKIDVKSVFSEEDLIDMIENGHIDVLVLMGAQISNGALEKIRRSGCLFFCVETGIFDVAPVVKWDQEEGAYQLGKYLTNLGHRDIAWMGGPGVGRLDGLARAFREASLDFSSLRIYECKTSPQVACAKIKELHNSGKMPSAMIFYYDEMAGEGIRTLKSLGYAIPDDISVASFGNTKFSVYISPELTTVGFDLDKFIEAVFRKIEDIYVPSDITSDPVTIAAELIVRGSCSAPRKICKNNHAPKKKSSPAESLAKASRPSADSAI